MSGAGPEGDGFDSPLVADRWWTTAGIIEMLPGVLPPLTWDVNRFLVEEAFRQLFDQLRVLPADIDATGGFVGRFRGRAALSLDAVTAMARAMPGGSEADVEEQYFGVASGEHRATTGATRVRRGARGLVHDVLVAGERRRATIEAETVIVASATVVADAPALSGLRDGALLGYRRRLIDLGARAMAAELAVAAAAVASHRRLELTLAKRVTADEVARWLPRLAPGALRRTLVALPPGRRASRAVFAGPTWDELDDDSTTLEVSPPRPTSDGQRDEAWEELIVHLHHAPNWSTVRAMTGQVADVRLLVLRRLVEDTNDLLARREAAKRAVLTLGGEVRRVHLELGRRWTESGLLDDPRDVVLVGERELTGVAAAPTRSELAVRRSWIDRWEAEPLLPQRFRGAPTPAAAAWAAEGAVLHGWSGAPGRHTGRARVLHRPDPTALEPGDVLVAPTTDASWMPVLQQAGAIVVEQGGPLSHAAIVARDLGIPAVLNVPGITAALDGRGCSVTVDGDEGAVHVHATVEHVG